MNEMIERSPSRSPRLECGVLVVEDGPADAELVALFLDGSAEAAYTLKVVPTLGEALEILSQQRFDCIITDLGLPDSKGIETFRAIHGAARGGSIVVLSADDNPEIRQTVLQEGAEDFLTKSEANELLLPRSIFHAIERQRARAKQSELENLVGLNPDAVVVTGANDEIRYVNDAAVELFGRPREHLLQDRMTFGSREGATVDLEIFDGADRRSAEVRLVQLVWRGERATLASIRDQTDRKKNESQILAADRMASVGMLAASVAHEINNPLAALMMDLELAAESASATAATSELSGLLAEAQVAAERIRQLVKDLRVFSRAEEEMVGEVELAPVLECALRMARTEIRHRAREERRFEPVPAVVGSEARLGQVFLNLIVNAAQSIPAGNAQDNLIEVATRMDASGMVAVDIRDTGSGMSPLVQSRLFTPFFTTKPPGVGTGLGLSICQRTVQAFGGRIVATSEEGLGTTFTVLLPVASGLDADEGLVLAEAPVGRRLRVLVIDDDEIVLRAVQRTLSLQHDVELEGSAGNALETVLRDRDYDLILCDLMMPEVDGMAVYARLTATRPELAKKLVFMTGGAFTPSARSFLDTSGRPWIEKPFDVMELRRFVNELANP